MHAAAFIDLDTGDLVFDDGHVLRARGPVSQLDAPWLRARVQAASEGHRVTLFLPAQRITGQVFDVHIHGSRRAISHISLRLRPPRPALPTLAALEASARAGSEEDAHPLACDQRHVAWLRRILGRPPYEHARGVFYAFPWGWLTARGGLIYLTYPSGRRPVPPPWQDVPDEDRREYRCLGCGGIEILPYGNVLQADAGRGAVPCSSCGDASWVQAHSTTEFYRFRQHPAVCEVGMHPAEDVRPFTLVRIDLLEALRDYDLDHEIPAPMASLTLKSCPEHVSRLRLGFLGFVLREPN